MQHNITSDDWWDEIIQIAVDIKQTPYANAIDNSKMNCSNEKCKNDMNATLQVNLPSKPLDTDILSIFNDYKACNESVPFTIFLAFDISISGTVLYLPNHIYNHVNTHENVNKDPHRLAIYFASNVFDTWVCLFTNMCKYFIKKYTRKQISNKHGLAEHAYDNSNRQNDFHSLCNSVKIYLPLQIGMFCYKNKAFCDYLSLNMERFSVNCKRYLMLKFFNLEIDEQTFQDDIVFNKYVTMDKQGYIDNSHVVNTTEITRKSTACVSSNKLHYVTMNTPNSTIGVKHNRKSQCQMSNKYCISSVERCIRSMRCCTGGAYPFNIQCNDHLFVHPSPSIPYWIQPPFLISYKSLDLYKALVYDITCNFKSTSSFMLKRHRFRCLYSPRYTNSIVNVLGNVDIQLVKKYFVLTSEIIKAVNFKISNDAEFNSAIYSFINTLLEADYVLSVTAEQAFKMMKWDIVFDNDIGLQSYINTDSNLTFLNKLIVNIYNKYWFSQNIGVALNDEFIVLSHNWSLDALLQSGAFKYYLYNKYN